MSCNLEKMRAFIESEIAVLLEKDPFWNKCYPCGNNGRCCMDDDPPALSEELEQIEAYLLEHPESELGMLENLRADRQCIFYDSHASSCLVHDVRPLVCRLTPFKGHVQDDGTVTVFDGGTNHGCSYFLRRSLDIVDVDGRFIRTDQNTYYRTGGLIDPPPDIPLRLYFYRKALEKGAL